MLRYVLPLVMLAAAGSAEAQGYADSTKYHERDVMVGADPWRLPATLTIPYAAGRHPAVVLVHGSGPNDRDETLGPNKPFRDIARGLASRGVVVLRYDKRTRVHGAKMDRNVTVEEEVILDALAALKTARANPEVDSSRVYILGHSLGGQLVPEIARRDGKVAGVIVMAGPARPLAAMMVEQFTYLGTLPQNSGPAAQAQIQAAIALVNPLLDHTAADTAMVLGAPASYFYDLEKRHGPTEARGLDIPVLVLQGERDYQVTMTDFELWKTGLDGRPKASFRSFPGLNHLFQPGIGKPNPIEYGVPTHVEVDVIDVLSGFIRRR